MWRDRGDSRAALALAPTGRQRATRSRGHRRRPRVHPRQTTAKDCHQSGRRGYPARRGALRPDADAARACALLRHHDGRIRGGRGLSSTRHRQEHLQPRPAAGRDCGRLVARPGRRRHAADTAELHGRVGRDGGRTGHHEWFRAHGAGDGGLCHRKQLPSSSARYPQGDSSVARSCDLGRGRHHRDLTQCRICGARPIPDAFRAGRVRVVHARARRATPRRAAATGHRRAPAECRHHRGRR